MYYKVREGHLRLSVVFWVDHTEVRFIRSELISTKKCLLIVIQPNIFGCWWEKFPTHSVFPILQLRVSR